MTSLCHTFYLHVERLKKFLFIKEVGTSLYNSSFVHQHMIRNAHKMSPFREVESRTGPGGLQTWQWSGYTSSSTTHQNVLCYFQDYFLPTSPELTGTCGDLGLYFILFQFLISLQLNGKCTDVHCKHDNRHKYYHHSHSYSAVRNRQWSDKLRF